MPQRFLTALPVYNEVGHVEAVLAEVRRYSPEILVVDDGSSDGTSRTAARGRRTCIWSRIRRIAVTARPCARRSISPSSSGYDTLVTIDCDGQHEPQRIPEFVGRRRKRPTSSRAAAICNAFAGDSQPPGSTDAASISKSREELNRLPGLEPHGRLLRLQGVSRAGAAEAEPHGERLRHAVGAVGPGGPCRLAGDPSCPCR